MKVNRPIHWAKVSNLFEIIPMEKYSFQLIKGAYSKEDAISLLTRLVDAKIKYHEEKIQHADAEEDIKMRENRIKQLQQNLFEARKMVENKKGKVELLSDVTLL